MNLRVLGTVWLALLSLEASIQGADSGEALVGVVRDAAGSPIAAVSVELRKAGTPAASRITRTDRDGRFRFPGLASREAVTLVVDTGGFQRVERRIEETDVGGELEIVLVPRRVSEQVTVTATRTPTRLADTAASVVVLSAAEISASAAPALDEALRQIPGFSLFRRSGSRTANPTSQGVSLRGIGASGASRATVLDDGVPLNDPFGGWVYWDRVPRAAVERIEVLRGGASDLYGSAALGGAIQLLRRSAASPFAFSLESSYGSLETPEATLFAGARHGGWGTAVSAEAFRTGGYVPVDPSEKGAVDTRVSSRHETLDLTVARDLVSGRAFLRGSSFDESRENGTPLQKNDTETLQATLGADWRLFSGSASLRAYGTDQAFHQTFSAVAPDRQSERLTRVQEVPSEAAGVNAQWAGGVGGRHVLVAGLEGRHVEGESREEILSTVGSSFVEAGGQERTLSIFLEDIFTASERLTVTGGVRVDLWWNEKGQIASRSGSAAPAAVTRLPDRSETTWSPRLSVLYRSNDAISLTASGYGSFRAPTLNELYRAFRVGDTLTLANERLEAERLRGFETGVAAQLPSGRFAARANLFWMEIEDAIGNVTVSTTPALTTRQRQNIGKTRSRGIELNFEARPAARWKLSGGYQFADSTVERFSKEPELEGSRVPQVPRHRVTFQGLYANPSFADLAIAARWTSSQFEDDQNRLALSSFWTWDLLISRMLWRGLDAFGAVENLLDERYEIGRTPVRTLGPSRAFRGGIRLRIPG